MGLSLVHGCDFVTIDFCQRMEATVSLNLAFLPTIETPQNHTNWLNVEMPHQITPANTLLKYILE